MTLKEKIMADLQDAVRSKDEVRRSALRLLVAGITNAEKEKGIPVDDNRVLEVISREVKRHKESITEFEKGKRQDLVDKEQAELDVLMQYLPQQMSREEIEIVARRVIEEVAAHGPGDRGKVMAKLMPQLKGKAEGREINEVVSELLAQR